MRDRTPCFSRVGDTSIRSDRSSKSSRRDRGGSLPSPEVRWRRFAANGSRTTFRESPPNVHRSDRNCKRIFPAGRDSGGPTSASADRNGLLPIVALDIRGVRLEQFAGAIHYVPDEHPEHHPEPSAAAALARRAARIISRVHFFVRRRCPNACRLFVVLTRGVGEFHFRLGRNSAAERAWRGALRLTAAGADREFLRRRLAACHPEGGDRCCY
jgi:hypothetical protein